MSNKHLKWGSHNETLLEILHSYCMKEEMTDITLRFQDGKINAHRIILSACSATFERILKESNTSEIYLCHISKSSMNYLIEFMYRGHVLVPSDILAGVLQAAEYFQVKGIPTANGSQNSPSQQFVTASTNAHTEQNGQSSVAKRRYGPPSSPVRRDRPRSKKPVENNFAMSPPTPERDRAPFRGSGKVNKLGDNMSPGEQNTSESEIFSRSVGKEISKITSPAIKVEHHFKDFHEGVSQLSTPKSRKPEQPLGKTKKKQNDDHSEGSSSKRTRFIEGMSKVVNPFAKRAVIAGTPDSDYTYIERPVADKKANNEGTKRSDVENDIEILVVDDAPIEITESLAEPANSMQIPDSDDSFDLACAPSKLRLEPSMIQSKNLEPVATTSRKAHQPGENFSSTDDDLPCSPNKQHKATRKKDAEKKKDVEKKEAKTKNAVVIKKPPPDRSKIVSKEKLEKYTEDLLRKPLFEMHQFCPLCFKYIDDIREHIKKLHKKMPKKKHTCGVCKKEFFNKTFFGFHKCIQEKDKSQVSR